VIDRDYKYETYETKENNHIEWIVKYPDLPGVIGSGDTKEKALKEASLNKDFYLDYLYEMKKPFPPHTYSSK
jgi:predicted RNase H-like HicB family nuclease